MVQPPSVVSASVTRGMSTSHKSEPSILNTLRCHSDAAGLTLAVRFTCRSRWSATGSVVVPSSHLTQRGPLNPVGIHWSHTCSTAAPCGMPKCLVRRMLPGCVAWVAARLAARCVLPSRGPRRVAGCPWYAVCCGGPLEVPGQDEPRARKQRLGRLGVHLRRRATVGSGPWALRRARCTFHLARCVL